MYLKGNITSFPNVFKDCQISLSISSKNWEPVLPDPTHNFKLGWGYLESGDKDWFGLNIELCSAGYFKNIIGKLGLAQKQWSEYLVDEFELDFARAITVELTYTPKQTDPSNKDDRVRVSVIGLEI